MDTLLKDGIISANANGLPVQVSGIDEITQRALIRLSVRKGGFIYDPDLGSDLFNISVTKTDEGTLKSIVCEALKDMPGVTIDSVEKIVDYEEKNLYLKVYLRISGQAAAFDIKIDEA